MRCVIYLLRIIIIRDAQANFGGEGISDFLVWALKMISFSYRESLPERTEESSFWN